MKTLDLGLGRTHPQVQARGYGPVYVDFLKQIHEELAPLHRHLIFWGDIGGDDPAAVPGLPKDMIAVPWNYWDSKRLRQGDRALRQGRHGDLGVPRRRQLE